MLTSEAIWNVLRNMLNGKITQENHLVELTSLKSEYLFLETPLGRSHNIYYISTHCIAAQWEMKTSIKLISHPLLLSPLK